MDFVQLRRMLERMERESKIWCPHCGSQYSDDDNQCISYHGQDNDAIYEVECEECGEDFEVLEHVSRTYESRPVKE